jgi:hypothetical protein
MFDRKFDDCALISGRFQKLLAQAKESAAYSLRKSGFNEYRS